MPRNVKPNSPKGKGRSQAELSDAVDDLETSRKIHTNEIATLKWVVGLGLGAVLLVSSILFGVVVQITLDNSRENAVLRADFHTLQTEFEVYKATNPPPVAIVPPIN